MAKHGTISAYTNDACRCNKCREAHRVYQYAALQRRIRRAKRDPHILRGKHGKASTYSNYACRCIRCTRAWTEYTREKRARLGR